MTNKISAFRIKLKLWTEQIKSRSLDQFPHMQIQSENNKDFEINFGKYSDKFPKLPKQIQTNILASPYSK